MTSTDRHRLPGMGRLADRFRMIGLWTELPTLPLPAHSRSGNDPFTVKAALKGTATYNGDASGLYSAGGMVEYFDADVSSGWPTSVET